MVVAGTPAPFQEWLGAEGHCAGKEEARVKTEQGMEKRGGHGREGRKLRAAVVPGPVHTELASWLSIVPRAGDALGVEHRSEPGPCLTRQSLYPDCWGPATFPGRPGKKGN